MIILISLIVCFYSTLNTNHKIQILPSLSWTNFILIPLFFSWNYFDSQVVQFQFFGVIIVHLATLLTDLFSIRLLELKRVQKLSYSEKLNTKPRIFLLLLIFIVPLMHYFQVGVLPIFNSVDRETFNKFGVPYTLILLTMLVTSVIMPFILLHYTMIKFFFLSIIITIWALVYILITGARGPFFHFLGALLIAFALLGGLNRQKLIFVLFFVGFLITFYSGLHSFKTISDISKTCKVPIEVLNTPANILRTNCPNSRYGTGQLYEKYLDTIGYRLFLTPVEVSYYWYDFTISNNEGNRSISNLFDRDNEDKFSNKVGIKYYVSSFPDSYGTSINANASIDADAFSFNKFYSVIFVTLIYSFIRVFIGVMSVHSRPSIRILSGIGLSKLILLPFSAGLQAVLVPHGLALIIFLILLLNSNYARSKIFK